jgi:hypothetical protein
MKFQVVRSDRKRHMIPKWHAMQSTLHRLEEAK